MGGHETGGSSIRSKVDVQTLPAALCLRFDGIEWPGMAAAWPGSNKRFGSLLSPLSRLYIGARCLDAHRGVLDQHLAGSAIPDFTLKERTASHPGHS